jgi:hypothetical protein
MDLLYLDFSKMEDGNMLLLTQEFHLILKLKLVLFSYQYFYDPIILDLQIRK